MQLSSIVTIVLRLFSLLWLLTGIIMFATVAGTMNEFWTVHRSFGTFVPSILEFSAAVLLFLFSERLARIVTPPPNPEINLAGLSQYDLYCFAFTFLGLYFVLSSIADSINWLHYAVLIGRRTHENDPQREQALYKLARPLITLIAGGASLLFAPRCARKLTKIQRTEESPAVPSS